jgi:hypothetical protein
LADVLGDREAQAEADAGVLGLAEQRAGQGGQVRLAGQVVHGHQLKRLAAQDAHAVQLAAVRAHPAEAVIVQRGRHQAAAAETSLGWRSHWRFRPAVVHHPAQFRARPDVAVGQPVGLVSAGTTKPVSFIFSG